MHFSAGLSFYKPERFGLNIRVLIPIQQYEYTSWFDSVSYTNRTAMILVR